MSSWNDLEGARHPVNVGHLVMGIAFLGIVAIWALVQADVVEGGDIRWLMPVPWVLAGAAGLLAIVVNSRRGRAAERTEPAYDDATGRDVV